MSATREPSAWSGAIPAGSTGSARRCWCASSKPTGSAAAWSSASKRNWPPAWTAERSAGRGGQDSTLAANSEGGVGNLLTVPASGVFMASGHKSMRILGTSSAPCARQVGYPKETRRTECCVKRFEDKTILVTGAGSGIGAACVRRLFAEGASIAAADVRKEELDKVVSELGNSDRIYGAGGDVSNRDQVAAFVS